MEILRKVLLLLLLLYCSVYNSVVTVETMVCLLACQRGSSLRNGVGRRIGVGVASLPFKLSLRSGELCHTILWDHWLHWRQSDVVPDYCTMILMM